MTASAEEQLEPRAGDSGSQIYAEYNEVGQPWKKFIYVEPPRRVKEVLEEELYFWRDEGRIKHPSEGLLDSILDRVPLPLRTLWQDEIQQGLFLLDAAEV